MSLVAAILLLSAPAGPEAIDFFPLVKGNRWTYQDTLNQYTDVVESPVEIGGTSAIPVRTIMDGKSLDTIYYRVDKDNVSIVAFDAKSLLPAPIPVFRLGEGNWTFTGSTKWLGGLAPITIKGSNSRKGKRKVMGKDAEILEVRLQAQISGGDGGAGMSVNQLATYAAGIGLIKMEQQNVVNKVTQKSKVELVRFEPGTPGNP